MNTCCINIVFSVTTYGEVAAAYPSDTVTKRLEKEHPDDEYRWAEAMDKERGDLFRVYFHRVVLDEAHLIKNRTTQSQYMF